jgi:Uncharacterized membrane-associated protein/domain
MLMKILKRLSEGGMYSNKSVARELGIDESLVEQMISQLENMGYIEKDSMSSCNGGCGCSSSQKSSCCNSSSIDINMWKVTDKGKKYSKLA